MIEAFQQDETAVSEIIGYTFVFGAILATVVFISLSAAPIIDNAQSQEATVAMENNLLQVDSEIREVYDGSDKRSYETEMPAGQFRQLSETTITLEDADTGNPITEIETTPLHYEAEDGTTFVYEAGVIAMQPQGATDQTHLRSTPHDFDRGNNPVLHVPALTHPNDLDGFSSTRATVAGFEISQVDPEKRADRSIIEEGDSVDVTVETGVPEVWVTYLEEHPAFENVDREDDVVTAEVDFDGDEFTVVSQEIYFEFAA